MPIQRRGNPLLHFELNLITQSFCDRNKFVQYFGQRILYFWARIWLYRKFLNIGRPNGGWLAALLIQEWKNLLHLAVLRDLIHRFIIICQKPIDLASIPTLISFWTLAVKIEKDHFQPVPRRRNLRWPWHRRKQSTCNKTWYISMRIIQTW